MRALLLPLWLLIAPLAAAAQEVVAALDQTAVSIDSTFAGSEILVFGAIRPEPGAPAADPPPADPLEVIVAVAGPLAPATVRRKSRAAGIWVNTDAAAIDAAPAFYAVATSAPSAPPCARRTTCATPSP